MGGSPAMERYATTIHLFEDRQSAYHIHSDVQHDSSHSTRENSTTKNKHNHLATINNEHSHNNSNHNHATNKKDDHQSDPTSSFSPLQD